MKRHLTTLFTVNLLLIPFLLSAQSVIFPIHLHNGQTIETCNGYFVDSGGDTLTHYGNNQVFETSFRVPELSGNNEYIRIRFLFFELAAGDTLYVYDGADKSAPLLATGTGNNLRGREFWAAGQVVFLRFVSDNVTTARGWMAKFGCFGRCDAFRAGASTATGSFDFCPNIGAITFTGSARYLGGTPGNTTNISYSWNFEGTLRQGAIVTQTYPGPGAYPFRVFAIDNNTGCQADTIITVRLATIPSFNNTRPSVDTVCAGLSFNLFGSVQPRRWTGFPTIVESQAYITQNLPFISSLNFGVFPAGTQLMQESDLNRVCINIEHEDFGHLQFELECPNGTSVLLKDYSIGGANLGEPVIFAAESIAGKGYEYCFSKSAPLGKMSETSFQFHSYTDLAGDFYNNQSYLPAGTYLPDESFQNFAGCPLNGNWAMRARDRISGTSGFVLGWSLFFNDRFYPDSLIFIPAITQQSWHDQNGNKIGNNPATALLNTKGDYQFTFRALDNFGCSWDTIVRVTVLPLPNAKIVSDIEIPVCRGDSTLLTVIPELAGDNRLWLYQWMLEGANMAGRVSDTLMAKTMATYMVRVTDSITGCDKIFDLAVFDQNCDLRIPNVFTPNGDGMNDVFEIENLEYYPGSVMVIYNRHGRKVFENNDYYLNWWDGGNQPAGTYYYVLTYARLGKRNQTQGIITIVK